MGFHQILNTRSPPPPSSNTCITVNIWKVHIITPAEQQVRKDSFEDLYSAFDYVFTTLKNEYNITSMENDMFDETEDGTYILEVHGYIGVVEHQG